MANEEPEPGSPFGNDGETVYATEPTEDQSSEEREWPDHTDPEWLHYQYNIHNKSQSELADLAGVCSSTISYQMKKHDVKARDLSEAVSIAKGRDRMLWDEDWLREKYQDEELSSIEIANLRGVSAPAVRKALEREDIEIRDMSEATKIRQQKARDERLDDPDWLRHQYNTLGKSLKEVAEEIGCSIFAVRNAFERHDIQTRSIQAGHLNHHKKEKCSTGSDDRDLVSSDGIDATWRDLTDRDQGCYIPYRDPNWLQKQVNRGLAHTEIAAECECEVTATTIRRWLDRFDIGPDDDAE